MGLQRKFKFTIYVSVVIVASIIMGFTTMMMTGLNLTNLILGLAGMLVFNIAAYSTVNIIQKANISKHYVPELDPKNGMTDNSLSAIEALNSTVKNTLGSVQEIVGSVNETVDLMKDTISNITSDET